jgi:hypothetical protein
MVWCRWHAPPDTRVAQKQRRGSCSWAERQHILGIVDNTIRVWDGANGAILGPTIQTYNRGFSTLIAGMSNEVYWADMCDTPSIYVISQSAIKGDPLCTLKGPLCTLRELTGTVMALALTRDGTLVSGGGYETVYRDESADDFNPNADVAFSSELKLW